MPANDSDFYERNISRMCELLDGHRREGEAGRVGLELERILVDGNGDRILFSGAAGSTDDTNGVHAILRRLAADRPDLNPVIIDGELMGFSYRHNAGNEHVPVAISLEPGAQIEVSVGPAESAAALLAAIDAFDAALEQAARELGVEAHFEARGYDTACPDPAEIELIPKDRYAMMDAYLPQHGRYARDMMRCTTSTQVSVDYRSETDAVRIARRATVLGPVLSFLFDNAPVFRGEPSTGMARSRIWRKVDPERCGIIPGSLDGDFSFRRYAEWIASVHTILFTDRNGHSTDAGDRVSSDYLHDRELSDDELMHLISMVWPTFRFKGYVECREMDALPPRLAVACASIVAAILYDEHLEAVLPFALEAATADDVDTARTALETRSWNAWIYGVPVTQITEAFVEVARRGTSNDFDRQSVQIFASLWNARTAPKDHGLAELETLGR